MQHDNFLPWTQNEYHEKININVMLMYFTALLVFEQFYP